MAEIYKNVAEATGNEEGFVVDDKVVTYLTSVNCAKCGAPTPHTKTKDGWTCDICGNKGDK